MTSCAVHPTNNSSNSNSSIQHKNGHGDEQGSADGGQSSSLSSTSSSSSASASRNSSTANTSTTNSAESAEKRAKALKSLIKKRIDPSQDFIKSHNKRVKFSETMQVFLYEMPDNQMPQIIALKSPAELNLMEFQQYMFEPPAEYQDFLAFEPPPDYRDFIANSLGVFRNEVTFDYIDDDEDDSEGSSGAANNANNPSPRSNHSSKNNHDKQKSHMLIANSGDHSSGQNSKWQSMILDNNLDSLEEEQIIGVLKEDDILQAIGSQISLPSVSNNSSSSEGHNGSHQMNGEQMDQNNGYDRSKSHYTFEMLDAVHDQNQHHLAYDEHLSSEDFPVHHQLNSYLLNAASGHLEDEEDDEACCIDGSSPNGSLQDLASDSSITSQDTIILINQQQQHNKQSYAMEDNIYENVQNRSNGELGGLLNSGKGHFEDANKRNSSSSSSSGGSLMEQERRDTTSLPPDKTPDGEGGGANGGDAVLYQNTSELMATVNAASSGTSSSSLVGKHMSANVNDQNHGHNSGNGEGGEQSVKNNQQHSMVSKFRQNLMFYETMMQQNSAVVAGAASSASSIPPNSNNVNSAKHVPNENGRSGGSGGALAGQTLQQHQQQQRNLASSEGTASGASHLIPVRFPLYTIVDANRASSSSSLSSASSSTSSLVCTTSNANAPQTLSVVTNNNGQQSLSTSPTQQLHQVSPNSSSTSSTSSSSGNMAHEYLLQYGGQRSAMLVQSGKMLPEGHSGPPAQSSNNNNNNNFTVPSSSNMANESVMSNGPYVSHVNMTMQAPSQQQQHQLQLSPRPSGPQASICLVNNNNGTNGQQFHAHHLTTANGMPLRPGQVVYRYPYAFIQHSTANGVQTIRPVQYILQTNPQTGAQSVLYNPRQIVINSNSVNNGNQQQQQQTPTSSGANMTAAGGNSSSTSQNNNNAGQAQMMNLSGGHGGQMPGEHSVSIPVRRILVPQGTVLAPRIMHIHPHPHHLQQQQVQQQQQQHKQAPPPYQYYVQQRHQQAAVFAYHQQQQQHQGQGQQNGPIRAPTPTPGQIHTVDVNSNQHLQQLHGGHTDFPNPSEIRRRDGLYAYPQVLLKAEEGGNAGGGQSQSDLNAEERDELEEFVQQEQQRTDRIRKRYSFTEDDDPTFGFARRPSVRGIRPKFGTTNEIIQQMTGSGTLPKAMSQGQSNGALMQHKLIAMNASGQPQTHGNHTIFAYGTIPKNAQFINLNQGQVIGGGQNHGPQMISIVKQMGDVQLNDKTGSQQQMLQATALSMNKSTSMPNGEAIFAVDSNGGPPGMVTTMSRDQLKLQLQKQLERQMQQQQQKQGMVVNRVSLPPGAQVLGARPLSGCDELSVRGVPEGSSFSPNHPNGGNGEVSAGHTTYGNNNKDSSKVNLVEGKQGNVDMASYYSLNV